MKYSKNISDDALMVAFLQDGDQEAFRELFDRFFTPLSLFADSFLKDEDAASDVVQNVFVALFESRGQRQISNVKAYMYNMVRNACYNVIKHVNVVHAYEAEAMSSTSDLSDFEADSLVAQFEAEARVASALAQLPLQCRRVFEMSRFDGLSNQEIAEALDISKRTVETQISNALRTLRKILLSLAFLALRLCCFFVV